MLLLILLKQNWQTYETTVSSFLNICLSDFLSTHLIAARAWSEVLVRQVELLNAERAAIQSQSQWRVARAAQIAASSL